MCGMNIYVLTETENTDTEYVYVEAFEHLSKAKARLKALYNEFVIQGDIDSIIKVSLDVNFMFATYENAEGVIVHWEIKEAQLHVD